MIIASMALPLDSRGDWRAYLKAVKDNGGNTVRLFVEYGVGDLSKPNPACPFLTIGWWNPYALIGHPGYPDVPQRDLTQRDPAFWVHAREVLVEMKGLGLVPWASFRDHGSEPTSGYQRWNAAFFGNTKMFPGWNTPGYYTTSVDPAIPGGGIGPDLNDDFWRLAKWWIDLCYEVGIATVYGEPINEAGWPEEAGCTKTDQVRWFLACCAALRNLKYNLIIGSVGYTLTAADIMPPDETGVDLIDRHAIIEVEDIDNNPSGFPAAKEIWNTDGAWNGTGPGVSVFGIHDASPGQMAVLGDEARRRGAAGVCYLSQAQIDDPNGPWNLGKNDSAPIGAVSPEEPPPPPPPVEKIRVKLCRLTYKVANPYCLATFSEEFVRGTEPTAVCVYHKAPPEPPEPPKKWWQKLLDWIFGWLR